jgi:hypothetical protein
VTKTDEPGDCRDFFGGQAGRCSTTPRTLLAFLLAAGACSRQGTPPGPAEAELTVALSQAPDSVNCLSVMVASDHADRRVFDLGGPGSPASRRSTRIALKRLPVGVVVLSFDAFDVGCSAVAPTTVATLVGGPVSVTLVPGDNPPLTVVLTGRSGTRVAVNFDPNAAPVCAPGGSACVSDQDCCSRRCALDPTGNGVGVCLADEPPTLTDVLLEYDPDSLAPLGGRASFPAFDGDMTFVSFPRVDGVPGQDASADAVRKYVDATLEAVGFSDPRRIETPVRREPPPPHPPFEPQGPIELPRADFHQLATLVCSSVAREDLVASRVCIALADPTAMGQSFGDRFIQTTLGLSVEGLRDEIERPLRYWSFSQRERGVPVEHKGLIVVRRGDQTVTKVFGSVLDSYLIVNEVRLNPEAALSRALPALSRVERNGFKASPRPGQQPHLVLLPYGVAPAPPGARAVPALRFAYRVQVNTSSEDPARRAYMLWADAATGDLLKNVPESGEATPPSASPWCRDPATLPTATACPQTVSVDAPTAYANPRLSLTISNFTLPSTVATLFPKPPSPPPQVCTSSSTPADRIFRAASAFGQLERVRGTLQFAGNFPDLGKVAVLIDSSASQNAANFGLLSLTFVAEKPAMMGSNNCPNPSGPFGALASLPGAEDATIIAHEFGHLASIALQTSNPADNCGPDDCPIESPYNRRFFHDYADGYAAMLTDSPCVGGWAYKKVAGTGPDAVAGSCALAANGSALPRLLFADRDPKEAFEGTGFQNALDTPPVHAKPISARFPDHRMSAPGDYGDGQILGAALWHTWQGMRSQGQTAGQLPVWGRLNEAVWATGYSPTICPYSNSACDINIYRAGREMLVHYTDSWLRSDTPQTVNKMLSAFARAGIFLTPHGCLTGGGLGDTTPPLDPQFCKEARTAGDAIIDIDDNDSDPLDGTTTFGIRFRDDDFVSSLPNAPLPTFRVWTGAPFSFDANGTVLTPSTPLCNDGFTIYVRKSGDPMWHPNVPPDKQGGPDPVTKVDGCYGEQMLDKDLFVGFKMSGSGKIEYKVITTSTKVPSAARDSTHPGADLWPAPAGGFAPSVFFINGSGHSDLD